MIIYIKFINFFKYLSVFSGIKCIRPLIPPQILYEDLPLSDEAVKVVHKGRKEAEAIVSVNTFTL